jgi:hypothetical protein
MMLHCTEEQKTPIRCVQTQLGGPGYRPSDRLEENIPFRYHSIGTQPEYRTHSIDHSRWKFYVTYKNYIHFMQSAKCLIPFDVLLRIAQLSGVYSQSIRFIHQSAQYSVTELRESALSIQLYDQCEKNTPYRHLFDIKSTQQLHEYDNDLFDRISDDFIRKNVRDFVF